MSPAAHPRPVNFVDQSMGPLRRPDSCLLPARRIGRFLAGRIGSGGEADDLTFNGTPPRRFGPAPGEATARLGSGSLLLGEVWPQTPSLDWVKQRINDPEQGIHTAWKFGLYGARKQHNRTRNALSRPVTGNLA